MGLRIDIIPIGILLLVAFIVIDCVRNKSAKLLQRVIFYSFILYLLFVFQYTTGGLHFPPDKVFSGTLIVQLAPFQFVLELMKKYQSQGLNWSFWTSAKIYFSNLVMLVPLGVYLAVLFNVRTIRKAALMILLVSVTIETYQLAFSYFGLVWPRSFDVDDIMLNTVGGVVGYYISILVLQKWFHRLRKHLHF